MNINRIIIVSSIVSTLIFGQSCVSSRKYEDIKKEKDTAVKKEFDCKKTNEQLKDTVESVKALNLKQKKSINELSADTALLGTSNRKINVLYKQINDAYERLLQKVKELEGQNRMKTDEYQQELIAARKRLLEQEDDLKKRVIATQKLEDANADVKKQLETVKSDLVSREAKLAELQSVLRMKDSMVNNLKNTVQKALLGYKDKGLVVSVKNGKVYLSVDEKLLFSSGKYEVNPTGKTALNDVAGILKNEKDVNIMVEGHTDNVPYKTSNTAAVIKDNLDLSVIRATEVSKILINGGIGSDRITAAGRGDTKPVSENVSAEGRAKNRRTEIILTPKLDELFKILE
jgi:chemotaxis protein MotB